MESAGRCLRHRHRSERGEWEGWEARTAETHVQNPGFDLLRSADSTRNPQNPKVILADVLFILAPTLQDFRRRTVKLFKEKQPLSTDTETGGFEEFVVVDAISVRHQKHILVVEGKRVSLSAAMG